MTDIEADAGAGGAGAPPGETEANQAREGLTREYASRDIRVRWYAARCIHSGACIRALPSVFDPRRRPWIDITRANADAIAAAVLACPTGALKYERLDGGPNESEGGLVRITAVRNGPYLIRGSIELQDEEGRIHRETRVALCRCGRSKHKPFCDNSHRALGFRSGS